VGYIYANGDFVAEYKNNTTYFVQSDHLGSTRLMTGADGSGQQSWDYQPFGEQIAGDTGTTHKFTGKERDSESGLDNFGARYDASSLGRFMTPDSIAYSSLEDPQSLNLYSYVGNHPTVLIDPDGHCWDQWLCNTDEGRYDGPFSLKDAFLGRIRSPGAFHSATWKQHLRGGKLGQRWAGDWQPNRRHLAGCIGLTHGAVSGPVWPVVRSQQVAESVDFGRRT
jgi:RHS repeat-associated protein